MLGWAGKNTVVTTVGTKGLVLKLLGGSTLTISVAVKFWLRDC